MTKQKSQFLFQQTWILSVSSLITKVLSAFYRVPLQNLVGNRGFFVYQQVYPLYGLCTAVALTGLPMFVSQIIAENKKHPFISQRLLVRAAFLLGVVGALLLGVNATQLAILMGDRRLAPLILVLAGFYLLAPIEAVYRGIYQGHLQMLPTAISQVMEQVIRVGIIITAAIVWRADYY
ncbi:polysaccharide biosynthesis protein, partial [Lactobacillus sp. XV13L]|nr:polysaccharide biosynthesis protein [Lactobacillus sp. XV13L]